MIIWHSYTSHPFWKKKTTILEFVVGENGFIVELNDI